MPHVARAKARGTHRYAYGHARQPTCILVEHIVALQHGAVQDAGHDYISTILRRGHGRQKWLPRKAQLKPFVLLGRVPLALPGLLAAVISLACLRIDRGVPARWELLLRHSTLLHRLGWIPLALPGLLAAVVSLSGLRVDRSVPAWWELLLRHSTLLRNKPARALYDRCP